MQPDSPHAPAPHADEQDLGDGYDDPPPYDEPRRGRAGLVALLVLVVLLAVGAGLGAAARVESRPDRFRAAAVVQIDQEPAVSRARDNGLLVKLVSLRIKYAGLVTTTTFGTALADEAALPRGAVAGAVSAVLPPNSLLMQVVGTGRDRNTAIAVAQGAADKLVNDLATEQAGLGIPPGQRVTLTVVSPAESASKVQPLRKDALRDAAAAAGAVLVVGLALVVAWRRR